MTNNCPPFDASWHLSYCSQILRMGESLGTDTLKFILHKYDEHADAVVGEKFLRGILNNSGGGKVNKYRMTQMIIIIELEEKN